MNYREFGSTGWHVSEIGFGAWAIGGGWGNVSEADAQAALHTALDSGVNFIDTADVYGDGRSERIIRNVLEERCRNGKTDRVYVATKAGRRLDPHVAEGYNAKNLNEFVDRSRENLGVQTLDLLQLHCPPAAVYTRAETFAALDGMVDDEKIAHYGVSVERIDEALGAIEHPNVTSVQIIFNMFRQRPIDTFFKVAKERRVAILARVPLASGLLTGKLTRDSTFAADDHRHFNRNGEAFDRGETFSGVDFETGLEAVEELRKICPAEATMAQFALRWILQFEAVTLAIPGAKNSAQAADNAAASAMSSLDWDTLNKVQQIYDEKIRPLVHHLW